MTKQEQNNMWEDMYQEGKTGWDRGASSDNLSYWIERGLLKPCRVLVPGCGNGYEVITLAQKGFDVVAVARQSQCPSKAATASIRAAQS